MLILEFYDNCPEKKESNQSYSSLSFLLCKLFINRRFVFGQAVMSPAFPFSTILWRPFQTYCALYNQVWNNVCACILSDTDHIT